MKRSLVDSLDLNKKKKSDLPLGLICVKDFITDKESKTILEFLDCMTWSTDLSRRTQHYGYKYAYTSKDAKESAEDIPKIFQDLLERMKEYFPDGIDQIIVNEYTLGQGIAKHIDKTDVFADPVASISLLFPARMIFHECEVIDVSKLKES